MSRIHVRATYLQREQILVETSHATFIADHPVHLGGDGRGPSAGELVLMALDASTVLHLGRHTARHGLAVPWTVCRSAYRHGRVPNDGPLSMLMYMAEIAQSIETGAETSDTDLASLAEVATHTPIVRALTNGIALTERVTVQRTDRSRRANNFVNEVGREFISDAEREVSQGATLSAAESHWRIGATLVGEGLAMIRHNHQPYIATDAGWDDRGPTPEELLLAALATCTAFYIIHNAGFGAIPIDDVVVDADGLVNEDGELRSVQRHASVAGPVSDDEARLIEYFANHCYIGETFRRGPRFIRDVRRSTAGAEPAAMLYATPSTQPADGIGCDDGSCCIPSIPPSRPMSAPPTL